MREFKFAQAMIFAIEEINQNPALLSNYKLGYRIYNACGMTNIMKSAIDLANGQREIIDEKNCTKADTAQAVLGHSGSAPTMAFARVIGRFQIPVVNITLLSHVNMYNFSKLQSYVNLSYLSINVVIII